MGEKRRKHVKEFVLKIEGAKKEDVEELIKELNSLKGVKCIKGE